MMDPTGKGEMISPDTAGAFLEDFLESISNPSQAAYGHVFGLDKMQDLMSFIVSYNASKDPDDKIAGIRAYNCLDEGRETDDKRDIFLMPVLKNGDDLYNLNNLPLDDNGGILGKPAPCPNYCTPNA